MSKKQKHKQLYQIRVITDNMSAATAQRKIDNVRRSLNKSGFVKRFGDFVVTDNSVDVIRLS